MAEHVHDDLDVIDLRGRGEDRRSDDQQTASLSILPNIYPNFQQRERIRVLLQRALDALETNDFLGLAIVMIKPNGGLRMAYDMNASPLGPLALVGAIGVLKDDVRANAFPMEDVAGTDTA
jgi:hypothetical protein